MPQTDAWQHFLSDTRVGEPNPRPTDANAPRSEFHKDYDRIIFSAAFRRLSEKTQVVPFPETAYTRQRLTHSLEVSCVGRSLATHIYHMLGDDISDVCAQGDFEAVVAAACLAHDIGNPPFGHFGEKAIQEWARKNRHSIGLSELSDTELSDIERFEGNAQTFRILSRLQMSRAGGMRLTAATLGAVIKYPTFSSLAKKHRYKKHGCFEDDRQLFQETFERIERPADEHGEYARHPLAFLSEAADDICYAIIDLEDGCKAGLVPLDEGCAILEAIGDIRLRGKTMPATDKMAMGRALAINELAQQCVQVFADNTTAIIDGTFTGSLIDHCPASEPYAAATQLVREKVFDNERVIEMEAAGYSAIQGLLDILLPAAMVNSPKGYDSHVLKLTDIRITPSMTPYQRILACTDYVSGMTDRYCLELFQKLSGRGVL
jgi:dGTPase